MSAIRLSTQSARSLTKSTEIVIVSQLDGSFVERVTLIRYAGHYRSGAVDAFVVRDDNGKLTVRSDQDLGLTDSSTKIAYVADTYTDAPAA